MSPPLPRPSDDFKNLPSKLKSSRLPSLVFTSGLVSKEIMGVSSGCGLDVAIVSSGSGLEVVTAENEKEDGCPIEATAVVGGGVVKKAGTIVDAEVAMVREGIVNEGIGMFSEICGGELLACLSKPSNNGASVLGLRPVSLANLFLP